MWYTDYDACRAGEDVIGNMFSMKYSKRTLFMVGIALLSAVLYRVFPHDGIFQDMIAAVMLLGVLPYLSARVVINETNKDLGFARGAVVRGVVLTVLFLILITVVALLLARFAPSWFTYDDIPQIAQRNFTVFVGYNGILAVYALIYSVFLQGFVVNGMRTETGKAAIVFALILFALISGSGIAQIDAYVGVLLASMIAYYSFSVYYAFLFLLFAGIIINGVSLTFLR